MSKNNIHTETCHKSDYALWNRKRFTIGWGVSPCHSKLLALQILNTAELMDDVEHICHTLCRMVNIALKVYKSWSLLKNTIFISLCYSIHKFFLVGVTFSDVHVVTDTDYISHEGYHVSGLTNSLAMSDLGFLLIQILYLKSKKVAGRSKGEAGTGGIVTENRDSKTALKYFCGNIVLSHEAKSISNCKYSFKLIVCFVPGPEEIVVVHFLEVKAVEFVNVIL